MTALLDFSALSAFSLNNLRARESSFADTVSRMSSGLRLITAGDDIAAHMMSVRLDNRGRGWIEASRNIQNGLSMLQTAEGGMASILDAFGRMRELAIEAANGTYTNTDRSMIQPELEALRTFVYDTVDTTEFNGMKPLAGNASFAAPTIDLSLVLPTTGANPLVTAATQSGTYAVVIDQVGQRGALIGVTPAVALGAAEPPTIMTISSQPGSVNVAITDAMTTTDWITAINGAAAAAGIGVTAEITDNTTLLDDGVTQVDPGNDGYLLFRTAAAGSDKLVSVVTNKFSDGTGFSSAAASAAGIDMQGTIEGTPFSAFGLTVTAGAGSNGADGLSFTFAAPPPSGPAGTVTVVVPPAVVSDFTHVVQMAPNSLDEHLVTIGSLTTGVMATTGPNTLGTLSFATQQDAVDGIGTLDALIQRVSAERARIGAHVSALQVELTNAIGSAAVAGSAEGWIADADMAVEATTMMQAQLAQQVQHSVLQALHAQSNASLELMVSMLASSPLQAPAA